MKHVKPFLIAGILLCLSAINLLAQHGNVAAGGDATGIGGSMSYSIGQTDYMMYSSPQGNLSLGLQQVYVVVLPVLEIPETTVYSGEVLCYNATETVIVAGNGNHFIVEPNGFAEIIAGHNILMREGTSVESGGSLHAYISTTWCNNQTSLLAANDEEILTTKQDFKPELTNCFFKVYPNPTTGDFTLEFLEFEEFSNIQLEIYSAQGRLVLGKGLPAGKQHILTIAGKQPGIYLIRVMKENQLGIGKIIKQ